MERGRVREWCGSAVTARRLHLALTVLWAILFVPALLWWKGSVPFLVFCSVYANFVGHWSSFQASRAEVAQNESGDS